MKSFKLLSLVALLSMSGGQVFGMFGRFGSFASRFTMGLRTRPARFLVGTTLVGTAVTAAMSQTRSKTNSDVPDRIIPLIDQALEENKFSEAVSLMARFKIRTRLDVACCTDPSAIAAMDMLTVREWTNPKCQELSQVVTQEESTKLFQQELESTEKALEAKQLPCPNWIARYGMNQFMRSEEPLFVSDSVCYENRKKVLDQYKEALKDSAKEQN